MRAKINKINTTLQIQMTKVKFLKEFFGDNIRRN